MRRLVLALPALSLVLHCDLLFPLPTVVLPRRQASDLAEVYRNLPSRDIGRFSRPADPLNMIFLGTEEAVRRTLEDAGWTSLPLTIAPCFWEGLGQVLTGRRLTKFPPMNDFRVLGRRQDMNWVQVIRPVETRHHFRLWKTGVFDARGREVWWGSGNFDLSVRYWDFSHRPHPDMNLERAFLAESLKGSARVERTALLDLAQIPKAGVNAHGYPFSSDGRALLVELR
ncbi:MAG: LssY C-terminal domain-containing protein [Elusimicrobiota bacterium]